MWYSLANLTLCVGEQVSELKGHSGGVRSVSFSPDGSKIVSGSDDNTIRVWDASTGEMSCCTVSMVGIHLRSLTNLVCRRASERAGGSL